MSVDLSKTVAPKSDQLNADDLIAGPRTITISRVTGSDDPEQPVSIHFEGGEKTPYKPCKSMRRVLIHLWRELGDVYVGRRLTLYRDPNVKFGGIVTGGIRISHASHIEREQVIPLMVKRGQRAAYSVKPLSADRAELRREKAQTRQDADDGFPGGRTAQQSDIQTQGPGATLEDRGKAFERRLGEATTPLKCQSLRKAANALFADLERADPERAAELEQTYKDRLETLEIGADDFPGDRQ